MLLLDNKIFMAIEVKEIFPILEAGDVFNAPPFMDHVEVISILYTIRIIILTTLSVANFVKTQATLHPSASNGMISIFFLHYLDKTLKLILLQTNYPNNQLIKNGMLTLKLLIT